MHSIAETHVSKRPGGGSTGPSSFFLVLAIITICNVAIAVAEASDDAETVQAPGVDMSDSAHSNKADPDYGVVFPDDQVQVMTTAISPDNWQKTDARFGTFTMDSIPQGTPACSGTFG